MPGVCINGELGPFGDRRAVYFRQELTLNRQQSQRGTATAYEADNVGIFGKYAFKLQLWKAFGQLHDPTLEMLRLIGIGQYQGQP